MFGKFFSRKPAAEDAGPSDEDIQLAVAALMVEAARADERYDDREKEIIDHALKSAFSLSAEAASALRARAEAEQDGALDIQRFTRIAKQMDHPRKSAFIEGLWEIVLSDGERDPFEDALIRRICGLIYFDDKDSGAARSRVEARLRGD